MYTYPADSSRRGKRRRVPISGEKRKKRVFLRALKIMMARIPRMRMDSKLSSRGKNQEKMEKMIPTPSQG
jgi:hypothetical protein